MKTWKQVFTHAAAISAICLASLSHARAGETCNFSFVEDEVKNAAEEMVTAAMERLLDSTSIDYDESRIEVTSHWKPVPYTIQGMDGKTFSGENIHLVVLARLRTKTATYKMAALNLFSAGVRKVPTNADVEGKTQPEHDSCVIDFSKKGKNPILLVNLKNGHSVGKIALPTSNSMLNVNKRLVSE
jgi:hypothetical protein